MEVRSSEGYLLSNSSRSPSSLSLYSVATIPGTANLTPLTTMVVAQLLAVSPSLYFEGLRANDSGFTAATDAAIADAEQRVRRFLQREYGFIVPASLSSFITSQFQRIAGDPMYDTVTALVTQLGTNGNVGPVVAAIAQEAGRCKLERVSVAAVTSTDDFCPFTKSNTLAGGVRTFAFTNRHGDSLALRLRGSAIADLTLTTREGTSSRCSGTACNGLTVGPAAANQARTFSFAGTQLSGTAGALAITGTLGSAGNGVPLPGLPCTDNLFYLVDEVARTANGYCAAPDSFGLNASGGSAQSGATRRKYTFDDGAGSPTLEVVVNGNTVISALVSAANATTGLVEALYRCQGAACSGVTLGAPTIDQSLGIPLVLQPIRFDAAVLPAILPDGTASTTSSIKIEAHMTGFWVDDPSLLPFAPVACAANAPTVNAQPSDEPNPIAICEPANTQGFTLRSTFFDGSNNLVLNFAGLSTDGGGAFAVTNGITVTVSPAGSVLSVLFEPFLGPSFRCTGAACAGVAVGAPDGTGQRIVTFTGLTLTEIGTGGVPADRTARLERRFIAPHGL